MISSPRMLGIVHVKQKRFCQTNYAVTFGDSRLVPIFPNDFFAWCSDVLFLHSCLDNAGISISKIPTVRFARQERSAGYPASVCNLDFTLTA